MTIDQWMNMIVLEANSRYFTIYFEINKIDLSSFCRMMSAINFEDHQKVTSSKRAKKSTVTPGLFNSICWVLDLMRRSTLRMVWGDLREATKKKQEKNFTTGMNYGGGVSKFWFVNLKKVLFFRVPFVCLYKIQSLNSFKIPDAEFHLYILPFIRIVLLHWRLS